MVVQTTPLEAVSGLLRLLKGTDEDQIPPTFLCCRFEHFSLKHINFS